MGVLAAIAVAFVILFIAGRIILGWVLPAPAMAGVGRFFDAAGKLCFQLCFVLAAAAIVYVVWKAFFPG